MLKNHVGESKPCAELTLRQVDIVNEIRNYKRELAQLTSKLECASNDEYNNTFKSLYQFVQNFDNKLCSYIKMYNESNNIIQCECYYASCEYIKMERKMILEFIYSMNYRAYIENIDIRNL